MTACLSAGQVLHSSYGWAKTFWQALVWAARGAAGAAPDIAALLLSAVIVLLPWRLSFYSSPSLLSSLLSVKGLKANLKYPPYRMLPLKVPGWSNKWAGRENAILTSRAQHCGFVGLQGCTFNRIFAELCTLKLLWNENKTMWWTGHNPVAMASYNWSWFGGQGGGNMSGFNLLRWYCLIIRVFVTLDHPSPSRATRWTETSTSTIEPSIRLSKLFCPG